MVGAVCIVVYLRYIAQHSPSIIGGGYDKSLSVIADSRWLIESVGGTDTAEPLTRVTLSSKDKSKTYFSSVYSGDCSIVDKSNLEVNQISGVTCWWAGGGNKVGIFNENRKFILKEGLMDEGSNGEADDGVDRWVTTKEIKP